MNDDEEGIQINPEALQIKKHLLELLGLFFIT